MSTVPQIFRHDTGRKMHVGVRIVHLASVPLGVLIFLVLFCSRPKNQ